MGLISTLCWWVLGAVLIFGPSCTWAGSSDCELSFSRVTSVPSQFSDVVRPEVFQEAAWAHYRPTWELYQRLARRKPWIASSLPRETVLGLLGDLEAPLMVRKLQEALKLLSRSGGSLEDVLAEQLAGRVPKRQISERRANLRSVEGLRRALGEKTLEEVQELFFGKSPKSPSRESLLGQYVQSTKAEVRGGSFLRHPDRGGRGEPRAIVGVSEQSFAKWLKRFSIPEWVSVVGHANMIWNGEFMGFNGDFSEMRYVGEGGVLPVVLLSTREAERLYLYRELIRRNPGYGEGNVVRGPWFIPGYLTQPGGYNCCTHWWGNMPIGEKLVDTYRFPNRARVDGGPGGGVMSKIQSYDSNDVLLQTVWSAPGHQQFADLIGQGRANQAGEFASPGYVISTLLGPASRERVPIVFYFTQDHRELPKPLQPQYEHPR